jgi:hypothetical protein
MQESNGASNSSQRLSRGLSSPFTWALIGLTIGIFWLLFMGVFFAAPQSAALTVVLAVSEITCPPLLLENIFAAPVLNAILYGVLAFTIRRLVRRWRRVPAARPTPR